MWKHFISDYLTFTKKDRRGTIVILILILLFITVPFLFPFFIKQKTYDHSKFEKSIASLKIQQADSSEESEYTGKRNTYRKYDRSSYDNNTQSFKGELFYFDPNTASVADWKKLGLRDKTIATIQNYLSKGGRFYKKEDIGKIWGLREDEVKRLMPYIEIKTANTHAAFPEKQYEKKEYKKSFQLVDINTADTSALIALPGIGSKLAQRIINFRDKLGGFYKVEQIGETFGLPDSTFQKIKSSLQLNSKQIKRIDINKAGIDEMKSHPYIRYALANAIFQYRSQHGNFTTVADIKKIMTVTEEIFAKVAPYLEVD